MARRPTQFGTAQVKQRDAVRPLLVLLLIGAGGILLFLWLQSDTVDPVVAVGEAPMEPEESAPVVTVKVPTLQDEAEELEDWWFDVESRLVDALDALDAAKEGSCDGLERSVADLGAVPPRREQPIQAPFSAIVSSLDRALAGCRNGNTAIVEGGGRSARGQVKSLTNALKAYGLPPSTLLSEI